MTERSELELAVVDATNGVPLACRVIVTAADGSHPDGGGRGVYADGRFFCAGTCRVTVPPGPVTIAVSRGPAYVPQTVSVPAADTPFRQVRVALERWYAPEDDGWYGCDHHVHAQHDVTGPIGTDLAYTAVQGRAAGLSCITEAGSHVSYTDLDELSTADFLLCHAPEIKEACYTGHFTTPGLTRPLEDAELAAWVEQPLFSQALVAAVQARGGVVTYTHPLTPPHQLHWMGATSAYGDAVLGRCAPLFDLDSRATELLWFCLLNLGNRVACSSYTDSALERPGTLTPGDRRVYCQAGALTPAALVEALRAGRTVATNGGPLFAVLTVDGHGPGATVPAADTPRMVRIVVRHRHPLQQVELYRNGRVVHRIPGNGTTAVVDETVAWTEREPCWYLLRAQDEHGHWCITSPVYLEGRSPVHRGPACALVWEIANHTRCVQLSTAFVAHLVVTASPDALVQRVTLRRDGVAVRSWSPTQGDQRASSALPVTQLREGTAYEPGCVWVPAPSGGALQGLIDEPIAQSGLYTVHISTAAGEYCSDGVRFDAAAPNSHELSLAHLWSEPARFTQWGYGEELPLAEVPAVREDRWWYPREAGWRVRAVLDGAAYDLCGDHPYDPARECATLPPALAAHFVEQATP